MPAKIRKQGKKYQVYNTDTGKVYGTHKSRAAALAQLRALYANVPDMKEKNK